MPKTNNQKFNALLSKVSGKIKYPLCFKIRKREETALILGTHHMVPLSYFTKECLDEFSKCSVFITEEATPPKEEVEKFIREEFLRYFKCQPNEENWFQMLSVKHREIVQQYFNDFFHGFFKFLPENCIQEFIPEKITFSIVAIAVHYAARPLFFSEEIQHTQHVDTIGMDNELMDLFPDSESLGLSANAWRQRFFDHSEEQYDLDMFKIFLDEVEAIKNQHNLQDLQYGPIFTNAFQKGKDEYLSQDLIYNFQSILEDEEEDAESDFVFAKENIEFLHGILKLNQEIPGRPLYGVGANHLHGSRGLLSLLHCAGYEIQRMDSHGRFHKFNNPYAVYMRSYTQLSSAESFGNNITPMYTKIVNNTVHDLCNNERNSFFPETIQEFKKSSLNGCFL